MSESIEKIKELLALMQVNDIVELELEEGDFCVALRKQGAFAAPAAIHVPAPAAVPAPSPVAAGVPAASDPALIQIKSPIVGTFYRSPSPDGQPFVKDGDPIRKDTVVCIIEAMKIMNEIRAEAEGQIERVLVESGEPVEYGQPLFLVRRK